MQATLVTGFAFGVLGPDVIEALPFFDAPVITYVYNMSATMSMLCSTGAVVMSSILMWEVNRLSLYGSVSAAVVAARRHEIAVIGIYLASLALLTVCVCFGFLATCEAGRRQREGRDAHRDHRASGIRRLASTTEPAATAPATR